MSIKINLIVYNKDTNAILVVDEPDTNKENPLRIISGYVVESFNITTRESLKSAASRILMDNTGIFLMSETRFILFDAIKDMNSELDVEINYLVEVSEDEVSNADTSLVEAKTTWMDVDERFNFLNLRENQGHIILDAISFYVKIKPGKFNRNISEPTSAIAIMRAQPLHNGHLAIINKMIAEHDSVTVGLGSCNKPISDKNPWTGNERKSMLRQIYGSRIKILLLDDLDHDEENAWADHILSTTERLNIDKPTYYYSGSEYDSKWYKDRFENIIIVDREGNEHLSGTEIRNMILSGDPEWKNHVPRLNHELVEQKTKTGE